eukprot:4676235-Karenia_brevis.AAC.1
MDDMEHAEQVEKNRVSGLIKAYRNNMAKCEEQFIDFSRGLTRKNKLQVDKGPNFPEPPVMGESQGSSS